jgi:integrase-like protein
MMGLSTTSISSETAAKRTVRAVNVGRPEPLDRLREALRSRHYSHRTEQTYCHWVMRTIHFSRNEILLRDGKGVKSPMDHP